MFREQMKKSRANGFARGTIEYFFQVVNWSCWDDARAAGRIRRAPEAGGLLMSC